MAVQLEVSINAVQKALMRLASRGILERKPNLGTIVSARQDATTNVFLLIGPNLRDEICHFDRRLSSIIEEQLHARGYTPIIYDGLNQIFDSNSPASARSINQLLADVTELRPKAIVEQNFITLRVPELIQADSVPIVTFRPLKYGGDVYFDTAHLYAEAARLAVENGRTKAMFVLKGTNIEQDSVNLKAFWESARQHGLTVSKILQVTNRQATPEQTLEELLTRELQLWKQLPPRKRPDTIIVMDDILMRTAAICLLREGISVPHDLLPVTLRNEGIDLGISVPFVGLETPLTPTVERLVDVLDIRLGRAEGPDPSPLLVRGEAAARSS
jgi:DNA-binding LacI/PurR family transcriptional regulator